MTPRPVAGVASIRADVAGAAAAAAVVPAAEGVGQAPERERRADRARAVALARQDVRAGRDKVGGLRGRDGAEGDLRRTEMCCANTQYLWRYSTARLRV